MSTLFALIAEAGLERLQLQRLSTADQVAGFLRGKILSGEVRPGTPLQEVPWAVSLGISRNTMREAMRILCFEGLIQHKLHRGAAVAQLSMQDVEEIYRLRRMLEISAVHVTKAGDREQFQEMKTALQEYEKAVNAGEWAKAVECDFHFHHHLIRAHRIRRLEKFYQNAIAELRLGMVLVDRMHDDPGRLIPVHREIYSLLACKQARGMCRRARRTPRRL